ncbi:hypothetical protein [Paradevosia shaoguanensis]|uniref:Uncharacterized protein n=1 Tax=Paradevosia shaoguanensis TaxID=1335043 RepID=A0AA41UEQ9_9HYPH|nr:hypothetical protein [Paradevosia shaoguanensis]MCF1744231.1 hypothetical protein [Paradevosia shaoguanensis]MCI0128714.1 hypothetical protein [Paradevosia shaoguanensis]
MPGLRLSYGGEYPPAKQVYVRLAGVWTIAQQFFDRQGAAWIEEWKDEVVVTLANRSASFTLVSLFTPTQWADPYLRKRVVIPLGVEVGANQAWGAICVQADALTQADSFAGELVIDNFGTISGIGGVANSGVGGNAFYGNFLGRAGQKLVLNNAGTIRAGGGGGGRGGNGGAGSYTQTVREPSSGDYFTAGTNAIQGSQSDGDYTWQYRWGGTLLFTRGTASSSSPPASFGTSGIYTYYSGTIRSTYAYGVYRTYVATIGTTGGAGGNGGRGQGYDGAAAAGSPGSAGGTNAGTGNSGGAGGSWGAQGSTGGTGSTGNVSAGAAGATGGLAGYYISGLPKIIFNNTGTVQGRSI